MNEQRTSNYQLRAVEPPASEIEAEIMEQLAQRPHDRLCVEALALIQRLRMRAPSAANHYDCTACDQPGEHCARPHGICRRAVPPPGAWQPIETAPKGGKWVLLWWPAVTDAPFVGYCVLGEWRAATSGDKWPRSPGPTHWMPLPAPPVCGPTKGESHG